MTEINYISDVQFREVIKNIDQNATILFHQVLLLHCDNDMLLRKDLRDTSEVEDHFYGWICKSPNFGFIMMAAFIEASCQIFKNARFSQFNFNSERFSHSQSEIFA
jgi:hypothetical protein